MFQYKNTRRQRKDQEGKSRKVMGKQPSVHHMGSFWRIYPPFSPLWLSNCPSKTKLWKTSRDCSRLDRERHHSILHSKRWDLQTVICSLTGSKRPRNSAETGYSQQLGWIWGHYYYCLLLSFLLLLFLFLFIIIIIIIVIIIVYCYYYLRSWCAKQTPQELMLQ